jgi:hypothetical protein
MDLHDLHLDRPHSPGRKLGLLALAFELSPGGSDIGAFRSAILVRIGLLNRSTEFTSANIVFYPAKLRRLTSLHNYHLISSPRNVGHADSPLIKIDQFVHLSPSSARLGARAMPPQKTSEPTR